MKRGLSIVLVLMLLVSLVPLPALAAGEGYETITGSIMFNAGHDDMETDHPCPFTYSDGYFTDTAYRYRQDLAAVTMAMCLASGNVADPERYREGPANLEDFFKQIGFPTSRQTRTSSRVPAATPSASALRTRRSA